MCVCVCVCVCARDQSSKWADGVMQVFAFDEASEDAFSDSAFEFRFLVLHYASLMHACALIDMRQDEHLTTGLTLQREDPYMFCPNRVEASSNKVPSPDSSGGGGHLSGGLRGHDDQGKSSLKCLSSSGTTSTPKLAGRSTRALTVPLQMVLRSRAQMLKSNPVPVNSFAAIDAMEKAVRPVSVVSSAEASFISPPRKHSRSIKRGQVSTVNFLKTTVFSMGSKDVRVRHHAVKMFARSPLPFAPLRTI
jgi:hypothetical protein